MKNVWIEITNKEGCADNCIMLRKKLTTYPPFQDMKWEYTTLPYMDGRDSAVVYTGEWDTLTEDMQSFSKEYPDKIFMVVVQDWITEDKPTALLDESSDVWIEFHKNGEYYTDHIEVVYPIVNVKYLSEL